MILFWLLALLLIVTAVFTVTQKSPVYSVVGLLANFVVLATLFLTLDAEFVFVIQIVVYGGAVLVLFVFVIALLSSGVGPFAEGPNRMPRALVPAAFIVLVAFAALVYGLVRGPLATAAVHPSSAPLGAAGDAGVFGSIADFGAALFTTHLLPFEVTSLILMVAVVGVVMLAGDAPPERTHGSHSPQVRRKPREREPIVKAGR
ncbi:MAG: NADH-quinone oxidoreductase subunit J [Candidatus Eremiobacteraeota bacterium]|nr:NADH-quinone oxidoreductase subunit J [Candidatus Eremiobacteraeota bacterium]